MSTNIYSIHHHFSDGLYAKETLFKKDSVIVQHKHKYDHLGILAKGKVIVSIDNKNFIVEAPFCLNIKKNKNHGIIALEDCVWYCVHATDETDKDKIDQVLIKE
jgi:quercetin dioxygenase-like cupin family protein